MVRRHWEGKTFVGVVERLEKPWNEKNGGDGRRRKEVITDP